MPNDNISVKKEKLIEIWVAGFGLIIAFHFPKKI